MPLPAGTLVYAEFRWDNSAAHPRNPNSPPKRIIHGEGSEDEMGGLWIGGELNSSLELLGLLLANFGHIDEVACEARAFRKAHGILPAGRIRFPEGNGGLLRRAAALTSAVPFPHS